MNSPVPPRPYADLELKDADITLTALTFGINLYFNESFYAIPVQTLQSFELFRKTSAEMPLTLYATESMNEHKPVNKRVMGMLGTWLAPDAPQRPYVALELKSSPTPQDAPHLKYAVWGDISTQSNIISMAFPLVFGQEKTDEMLALVTQLAELIPFRSGLAGYSFECSRYAKRKSETHAWSTSMRHPGVDIVRIPVDAKALGKVTSEVDSTAPIGSQGVKGVGWLTLLDTSLCRELGGVAALRRKLPASIEVLECRHGVILQAGPKPELGDINRGETLPLYREIYKLLVPWISVSSDMSMAFQLAKDYVERTRAWYARLGT
jgi:hypothetical protein